MNDFELFAENSEGRPSDLNEVLALIQHQVDDHGLPFPEAIKIIYDLVNPGQSDSSHDVRPQFCAVMWAFGHGNLCDQFGALYLNVMPWGIGFHIGIEPGFEFSEQTPEVQRTIVTSLVAILQAGGIEAELTDDNKINIIGPEGQTSSLSIDDIVGQFKVEIDKELGPDGPDEMGRWMP